MICATTLSRNLSCKALSNNKKKNRTRMLKLMNLRQAEQSLISCFLFTTSQGSPREKGKP